MDLIMSSELVAKFEKVPTKAKTNFTKLYNNVHQLRGIKTKTAKKKQVVEEEEVNEEDLYDPDKIVEAIKQSSEQEGGVEEEGE